MSYLKTRDRKYLSLAEEVEKNILKMVTPMNITGGKDVNDILKNRLRQEELLAEMQLSGINNPEKLTAMRFYTILFKKGTKNKANE